MKACPANWLNQRMSLKAIEAKLGRFAKHPQWLEVKALARPDDEFWSFTSQARTWPEKLGAAGYALVRAGVPVASFTIMRS